MRSSRSRRVSQSDHITVIRFRKQFSLRILLIVTCFLGMNFAWVPWPGSGLLAIVIAIPLFASRFRVIELVVLYGIVVVLGAAMCSRPL